MPRRRSTTGPTSTPTRTPRKRPIVEPISAPGIEPDRIVFLLYPLDGYEQHGKCHPNYYGDCLGEFLTRAYAKRWLRDHERYGAFAIVERVNGKIGRAWPYEIDPPEDDTDYDPSGDPRVEIAKLQAKLETLRNGHGSPITERILERVADQMLKPPVDPLQSAVATIEAVDKIKASVGAKVQNPAPQQTDNSNSNTVKLLNSLIEHGEGSVKEMAIEKTIEYLKGEKAGQDILMDVLQAPQLIPAIQTAGNVLLGIVDRIFPVRQAQASTQPPQQQQGTALTPQQQDWFNQVRQQQPQATDAQIYEYMRQKRLIQ